MIWTVGSRNCFRQFFCPITIQKLLYIEKLVAKRTIKLFAQVYNYINRIKKARSVKRKAIYDKIREKRNIIINLSNELINDFYGEELR